MRLRAGTTLLFNFLSAEGEIVLPAELRRHQALSNAWSHVPGHSLEPVLRIALEICVVDVTTIEMVSNFLQHLFRSLNSFKILRSSSL